MTHTSSFNPINRLSDIFPFSYRNRVIHARSQPFSYTGIRFSAIFGHARHATAPQRLRSLLDVASTGSITDPSTRDGTLRRRLLRMICRRLELIRDLLKAVRHEILRLRLR